MKIYWSTHIDDYFFEYDEVSKAYFSYEQSGRATIWLSPFYDLLKLELICEVK